MTIMDLKGVFEECVKAVSSADAAGYHPRRSSSVFLVKAEKLRDSLQELLNFCGDIFDEYAGYHEGMPWFRPAVDLTVFDDVSSRLILEIAVEIKELQHLKQKEVNTANNEHNQEHHSVILENLYEMLQSISRELDTMKQQRRKYSHSFCRIHTELSISDTSLMNEKTVTAEESSKDAECTNFAERYVSEVAQPKQMRQYQTFFEEHKELLANENKELHDKFSEELDEAQLIERSVQSVAYLLSDFSKILERQGEGIEDVNTDSKAASAFVQSADEQLHLTIERSKSSQRNMVIVTIGLSVLLLLLDFLTP